MESSSSSKWGNNRPSSGDQAVCCMVDSCDADLRLSKEYHRRHKVCEAHSKSPMVSINGQGMRFCQQCSRFHALVEFDEQKRSCRKRLDGHNRRRRKAQPELQSLSFFPSQSSSLSGTGNGTPPQRLLPSSVNTWQPELAPQYNHQRDWSTMNSTFQNLQVDGSNRALYLLSRASGAADGWSLNHAGNEAMQLGYDHFSNAALHFPQNFYHGEGSSSYRYQ